MTEPEVAGARLSLREYAYVIRRFWGFIRPYRTKFFLGILMVLLSVPIGQFVLFLTRDVTNRALVPSDLPVDERWRIVVQIALLQAGLFLLSSLLWVFREVLEWYVAMRATFDIRLAYYRHLLRLPLAFLRHLAPHAEDLSAQEVMCPDCGGRFHRWQHQRAWTPRALAAHFSRYAFTDHRTETLLYAGNPVRAQAETTVRRVLGRHLPNLCYVGTRA